MDNHGLNAARRRAVLGLASLTGAGMAGLADAQVLKAKDERPPSSGGAVDPRAYGARMDGQADDAASLRAAAATKRVIRIEGPMRIDTVVELPPETTLEGAGVHRSRIVLGPRGKLRISGDSFERRIGGGVIRNLTISSLNDVGREDGLELIHIDQFLVDNVTFYHVGLLMDDHHYVAFQDCEFFGWDNLVLVRSNCESQPSGSLSISEVPSFTRCFFSSCPVELKDTVGARFTDCAMFAGEFGVRSSRLLARGTDAEPFYMGPTLNGCIFDSIDGPAIEIEGGGTDCRIINCFISSGRKGPAPGIRLTSSSGMELIGNRFEWCGSSGLELERCDKIGLIGNSFANIASGSGIVAKRSRSVRVVGNAFENAPRWGGAGNGGTTLAINADVDCIGWAVIANTAEGLHDPRVSNLNNSVVRDNIGWPAATEQGWAAGPSEARPSGVRDGYQWYDQTLGLWIYWHSRGACWRNTAGRPV